MPVSANGSPGTTLSNPVVENGSITADELGIINDALQRIMKKQAAGTAVDISYENIEFIFRAAQKVFQNEGPLLNLKPPIRIIGDVHGQVHDILTYFDTFGHPSCTNYLFLGDYVDRGLQSIETVVLLCCLKTVYPDRVFVLRGNHETPECDQRPGVLSNLKRELLERFRDQSSTNENIVDDLMTMFFNLFDYLPLCAIIGKKIFAVHGCVNHDVKISDIIKIKLPCVFPGKTANSRQQLTYEERMKLALVRNLLWSDPMPLYPKQEHRLYLDNVARNNAGYCVSEESVRMFLDRYGFDLLIRGHEAPKNGINYSMGGRVLTLFGASNYKQQATCSSVMVIDEKLKISFVNYSYNHNAVNVN